MTFREFAIQETNKRRGGYLGIDELTPDEWIRLSEEYAKLKVEEALKRLPTEEEIPIEMVNKNKFIKDFD